MVIKCSKTSTELKFSEREGLILADGSEYFRVIIEGHNLSASSNVYAWNPFNDSLINFVEDLAENWKGWDGEKKWSSLEGELRLVCTADSLGHIEIEVKIYDGSDDWLVQKSFYIDSGQLEQIMLDTKKFFAL